MSLSTEQIVGIVTVVVGFTELIKLSKYIPDRFGLLIAAIVAALGEFLFIYSQPEFGFVRTAIWGLVSAYLVIITSAAGVYGVIRESRGGDVTDASKAGFDGRKLVLAFAILGAGFYMQACKKSGPVLIGESGVVASAFIETSSNAVEAVREPKGPIKNEQALKIQEGLLQANGDIKKLVPILRAIDAAQKLGSPDAPRLEEALLLVQRVTTTLGTVVQGVPVAEAAAKLLEVVNNARGAVATIQATLEALKAKRSGDLGPSIKVLEQLMAPPVPVLSAN